MHLRVARHTENLDKALDFYCGILGLEKLGGFTGHDGYDGIFIGMPGSDWHLEFTVSEEKPVHKLDEDDIIVFYPMSKDEYGKILARLQSSNIEILEPKNPYWRKNGVLVQDPDGHNVIISPQIIEA